MLIWAIDALLVFIGTFIIWRPRYGRTALLGLMPILSLAACSLMMFAGLEVFPSLIEYMPFRSAHYYDQRIRYVPDDELIYKYRPSLKIETPSFKGEQYHPAYGVDIEPVSYRAVYDDQGFRNGATSSTAWDVVVLGDSFIEFGLDEDDTFARRLEVLSGMKIRNLGIGGHGPFQYMKVLERYGLRPRPRYVLFCFFEGNDIADITLYVRWKETSVYPYYDIKGKNFLQRYLTAVRDVVFTPLMNALEGKKASSNDLVVLSMGDREVKAFFGYPIETRTPNELLNTGEWHILRDLLAQLKTVCADNGIHPIVVFIPTKAHIYAEYSTTESGSNWLFKRAQQIAGKSNLETALRTLCRENDLEFESLTPAFERAANEGRLLYYPFDSHWNSEGRQVGATVLASRLKNEITAN